MNSNRTAGKPGSRARATRIPRLAPTTRAIRAALAVSATVLALSGSGTALAGTCIVSALHTVSCDGVFTSTISYPDVDLTLILGANAPTSVNPGVGNVGVEASWPGDTTVITHADITSSGADGIHQYGTGTATLSNDGSIFTDVTASGANAVDISAIGDVSFNNNGVISAYSGGLYDVTAVAAYSALGNVAIDNQSAGAISASAYDGDAVAIYANGLSVDVNNDGEIHAGSFNGSATGIYAYAYDGDANVTNAGIVTAYALDGDSFGVVASVADGGDASVVNSGDVLVGGYGNAQGVVAISYFYNASIDNSGNVEVSGVYAAGGLSAAGYSGASVDNSGTVSVAATGDNYSGDLDGTGISAYAYEGDASVANSGDISVIVSGYGYYDSTATGIDVLAETGDAVVVNSGTISVDSHAYAYYGASAVGVSANAYDGNASVANSGSIDVRAEYGRASGVVAASYYGDADVDNSGSISATGAYGATGVYAYSGNGNASIVNSGDITALAGGGYSATGAYAYAGVYGLSASVDNSGDIGASGYFANGAVATAKYGDAIVSNSGSISADGVYSVGIDATAKYDGDVLVDNSGSIAATGYLQAVGISADTKYGNTGIIDIDNSGDITAYAEYGAAAGILANGYNGTAVTNSGDISVSAYYSAYGVIANDVYGGVAVNNSGAIDVFAGPGFYNGASATGVTTSNTFGDIQVSNSGSIAADAASYSILGSSAIGVQAYAVYGEIGVANSGSISASAESTKYAFSYGTVATGVDVTNIFGGSSVSNSSSGAITALAQGASYFAEATGVSVLGIYGDTAVSNAGSISATASTGAYDEYVTSAATGISVVNYAGGAIDIGNSGAIHASAALADNSYYSSANAFGINVEANTGTVDIGNSGHITVAAAAGENSHDVSAYAYGILAYGYDGDVGISNSGTIAVSAGTGDYSEFGFSSATGIDGSIGYAGYAALDIGNSGTITASAADEAIGISASSDGYGEAGRVYVANSGHVTATANGGDYAYATGITATGYAVYASNSGDIHATATGVLGAYATGLQAAGKYGVEVETADNSSITATATGPVAYATGIIVYGAGQVSVLNDGDIHALATGDYGSAIGLDVVSLDSVGVSNSGAITSEFRGDHGDTYGVVVSSLAGDVAFTNSGTITATDADHAIGVNLNSKYATSLVNEGTITAHSTAAGSIAVLSGDSVDAIHNYGTINGAIVTGAGDDYLYNAPGANWNAVGYSEFGAGNDTIYNAGTITMTDAAIYLGSSYAEGGNQFINDGVIRVRGDNLIDMGSGPYVVDLVAALVPSLNPYAFYNYGVIDFRDGAANDTLAIVGDFAGDGDILVDISGLHQTSDLLYIDGSVASGSSLIGGNLLDLPTTASTRIPVVHVSGNSVPASFALGTINYSLANFLTLGFTLNSQINATNASADVFSLGIDVTGLSDPGTLGAAIAPGVQSLMNSQVGTWRQRMGVIDRFQDNAVSLWLRYFYDRGTVRPEHVAANFGQGGNFDYDQLNSGVEAGVDFAVSDEFSIGLLAAKSRAKQNLLAPGVGADKIEGDTYGVYATWVSPEGFYVDGSYRWMSFDSTLDSIAGTQKLSGDAKTFNVELGYAWTLSGGLKVEPQLQYTRTKVDKIDVWSSSLADFSAEGGDSSRGRLGVSFRKSFGDADHGILWTPYGAISAVREFDGKNSYNVNNDFFGHTSAEGTSALVELGVTANRGNLAVWGGVNWQDGGALDSFVGGQLGVRYTFGHARPAPVPTPAAPVTTCADLDDDGDGVNNCDDKCPGSTAGQAVGPDGCPVPLTIDLKGVNFDFDQSTLRPDAVAILDEAIAILARYPQLKVEVAGHTDSVGSEIYNQGLSERRARTVYDYLAAHGIGADRMAGPNGYGETRPIAPNTNEDGSDNPEARARNRRTELNVQN